jgi:prephenate dehydrogenase
MKLSHIRIVGAGLIGTSLALALANRGYTVDLDDLDPAARDLARDLLHSSLSEAEPQLVVIATPPSAALDTIKAEFGKYPQAIFIDVGSVKNNLLREVEGFTEIAKQFIGTHPIAGREVAGPSSAQGDLFNGRAWILSPTSQTAKDLVETVVALLSEIGASTYVIDALRHDALLARISHLPQIISTSLGAALSNMDSGLDLAGQGLRDMTRIANSDGTLWSEILLANRDEVLHSLNDFVAQLMALKSAISLCDKGEIERIFIEGNSGRAKISGKHGAKPRNYSHLLVVIKDQPGALRDLFDECATLNANIEDLSIEHSPKQETGLITLAFSPEDALKVSEHLQSKEWKVHLR